MSKVRECALIALLAVLIALSGSFKIPGPLPGTEFQLSAPIAVAIAACFGFKRYILAGIVASSVCLMLGTHTFINVIIAMTFRVVAGGIVALLGSNIFVVAIAGPLGTAAARVALWALLGKGLIPMLIASSPGMIYTALTAWPCTLLLKRVKDLTAWRELDNAERI